MNPIIKNLIHKIEVKKTQAHLTNLKSITNQNMKIPFMLNKDSQAKIASLEASVSPNIITIQNSAGDHVVAVTSKDSSGRAETRNMSLEAAALHSKKVVAGFTSKATKATATAPAPAPAPAPTPASKEVAFEPTPTLKPLSRSEFNSLTPHDRTRFSIAGGKLK